MELSVKHLREAYQGLSIMSQQVMPTKIGMKVASLRIKLHPFWEASEEQRQALIKRFAEQGEDGKPKVENNEYIFGQNLDAFNEEFKVLMDEVVDLGDVRILKRHEFGDKYNQAPEIWFVIRHFCDLE